MPKKFNFRDALARFGARAKCFLLPCERNGYRARIFTGNFLTIFFISVLVLKLGFFSFMAGFSGNQFYADITKSSLINLANQNRAEFSLPGLVESPQLNAAAYMKAVDMEKNGYFAHTSPSGINPWHWFDLAGYNYRYAGENLAIGFLESNEIQDAWRASPTHEANIINGKYQEIGIAVYKANFNGNPATIVVQLFGTRQGGLAAAPASQSGNSGQAVADTAASQSLKNVLGVSTEKDEMSFGEKVALFFTDKYFQILQWVIYGAMAVVILLLLVNFALSADFGRPEILAKAFGFIVMMAVFGLIDRGLVITLIPHHMSIF